MVQWNQNQIGDLISRRSDGRVVHSPERVTASGLEFGQESSLDVAGATRLCCTPTTNRIRIASWARFARLQVHGSVVMTILWVALELVHLLTAQIPGVSLSSKEMQSRYLVSRWQSDDGYPHDSCIAVSQTSDGYLWFGSWQGLVRYNGNEFVSFEPTFAKRSLERAVLGLYPDQHGNLWTAHFGGKLVSCNTYNFG